MFCMECGEEVLKNAKFCPSCGTNVNVTDTKNQGSSEVNLQKHNETDSVASNRAVNIASVIIVIVVLLIWLSTKAVPGNSLFSNDGKIILNAEQILKQTLTAPDTYNRKNAEILWTGKDKEGNPAYFVNLNFTSQNVFGATLTDCRTVVYISKEGKSVYNTMEAINVCLDERGDKHDPDYIKGELERNDLNFNSK